MDYFDVTIKNASSQEVLHVLLLRASGTYVTGIVHENEINKVSEAVSVMRGTVPLLPRYFSTDAHLPLSYRHLTDKKSTFVTVSPRYPKTSWDEIKRKVTANARSKSTTKATYAGGSVPDKKAVLMTSECQHNMRILKLYNDGSLLDKEAQG